MTLFRGNFRKDKTYFVCNRLLKRGPYKRPYIAALWQAKLYPPRQSAAAAAGY